MQRERPRNPAAAGWCSGVNCRPQRRATAAAAASTIEAAGGADAHVLALCRAYMRLHDEEIPLLEVMRGNNEEDADRAYKYCDEVLWVTQYRLVDEIEVTPATTFDGFRAKAQVIGIVFRLVVNQTTCKTFDDEANYQEKLAMALICDVAGNFDMGERMGA